MTDKLKQLPPAVLTLDNQHYELPTLIGVEGEKAIDISKLRNQSNYVTLDEGYGNTASCESTITYIDGEQGILRYRGYPIEELAENSRFIEVAYLLLYDDLPNSKQLEHFASNLNGSSIIHEDMHHFFNGFPRGSHPMGILATMVASLSTFYPIPDQMDNATEMQTVINLVSQVRTIAAFSYKKSIGEPLVYPSYKYKYVRNFLNMMFSSPVRDYQLDDDIVRAIDMFLILHADHEQNCSTSSVRTAGSSMANVYAVASAGISALWGPRHGGANQQVIQMLEQIHAE
ncbi:MAG: citrate (Si)-synthase, partial [Methylobacter sp.]|nr:citrate (Si)-synthase [Methylobacter sp.]